MARQVEVADHRSVVAAGRLRVHPGRVTARVRADGNWKSCAPLQLEELLKIVPIVRLVLNRPYRTYDALVIPSAKTARAPARRKPAP